MDSNDFIRAGLMIAVVAIEWWAMQPYHEPVLARIWHALAAFCRAMAERFGWFALHAEHNYYIAAEAGI